MPIVKDKMTRHLVYINKKSKKVPKMAYDYWVKLTPVTSGNAKRKTKFKRDTIVADYDYATYLDKGSSSKAPKGMSKPTQQYIKKLFDKIMRN